LGGSKALQQQGSNPAQLLLLLPTLLLTWMLS
jgi:hypothetical protein